MTSIVKKESKKSQDQFLTFSSLRAQSARSEFSIIPPFTIFVKYFSKFSSNFHFPEFVRKFTNYFQKTVSVTCMLIRASLYMPIFLKQKCICSSVFHFPGIQLYRRFPAGTPYYLLTKFILCVIIKRDYIILYTIFFLKSGNPFHMANLFYKYAMFKAIGGHCPHCLQGIGQQL